MRKTIMSFSLAACLALAVWADEPTVFVNGVQLTVPTTVFAEQTYYPAEELAKSLGASFVLNGSSYTLNSTPLVAPPLVLGGKSYITLDSAVKTLGGQLTRDPVRGRIDVVCQTGTAAGGIPYYSKDYKTPEQRKEEALQREEHLGTADIQTWSRHNKDKLQAMYPTQNPVLNRVPELPSDFHMPAHPNLVAEDENTTPDGRPLAHNPDPRDQVAPFLARACENGQYRILVSDAKLSEALRGISPDLVAPAGTKYLVVQVTEENISKAALPTAWFGVRDTQGAQYVADFTLSQFNRSPLRPGEITRGYLIFELPVSSQPVSLEVLCTPILSVNLTR